MFPIYATRAQYEAALGTRYRKQVEAAYRNGLIIIVDGDAPPGGQPVPLTDMVGIGHDYTWVKNTSRAWVQTLQQWRIHFTSIEFMGGWDRSGSVNGWKTGAASLAEPYARVVGACREFGRDLFVSIVNDNKGLGKYGDDNRPMSDFKSEVNKAMQIVLDAGPQNVWVQTVSETRTGYGKELEATWLPKFQHAGFRTVWNRNSRPSRPEMGCTTFAYHTEGLSDRGKPGGFNITDTGANISPMTEGGIYGAALIDSKVQGQARLVSAGNDRAFGVYTFTGMKQIPERTVRALAAGWYT